MALRTTHMIGVMRTQVHDGKSNENLMVSEISDSGIIVAIAVFRPDELCKSQTNILEKDKSMRFKHIVFKKKIRVVVLNARAPTHTRMSI